MIKRLAVFAAFLSAILGGSALAGAPEPWQMGLPDPASPSAARNYDFHDMNLWVIGLITLFVLGLLVWVVYRYRESKNPVPSRTTHNTPIEIVWTVVPVIILVLMFIPSYKIMIANDRVEVADITLKVIGHQWYWSYEYPDHGNFTFDAYMVPDDELEDTSKRMMETDNRVVLPVGKKVRLLITSDDVLHSFSLGGELGVKLDAVPGRTNETWVQADKLGVYYSFCSEVCGLNHSYMPIAVEVVSEADFEKWVAKAQQEFARVDGSAVPVQVAGALATD